MSASNIVVSILMKKIDDKAFVLTISADNWNSLHIMKQLYVCGKYVIKNVACTYVL